MSAIERCRTAALSGHVARCENREVRLTPSIAYNSCRNRHCPKCQGAAAREWLAEREKPSCYRCRTFHVVYHAAGCDPRHRLSEQGGDLRCCCSKPRPRPHSRSRPTPRHLGARIALHVGAAHVGLRAMTHHPHVHMVVPGGGLVAGWHRSWIDVPADAIFLDGGGSLARCSVGCSWRCWSVAHDAGHLHVLRRAMCGSPIKAAVRCLP